MRMPAVVVAVSHHDHPERVCRPEPLAQLFHVGCDPLAVRQPCAHPAARGHRRTCRPLPTAPAPRRPEIRIGRSVPCAVSRGSDANSLRCSSSPGRPQTIKAPPGSGDGRLIGAGRRLVRSTRQSLRGQGGPAREQAGSPSRRSQPGNRVRAGHASISAMETSQGDQTSPPIWAWSSTGSRFRS